METSAQPKIVLYGGAWCGDCRRAQRWLDERGYAYEYKDIVAQPELADEVVAHNIRLGHGPKKRIPIILIEGHPGLSEPRNDELAAALGAQS